MLHGCSRQCHIISFLSTIADLLVKSDIIILNMRIMTISVNICNVDSGCVFVQSVLAAIVIVNLKGVFLQALDIRTLYRRCHYFDLVCCYLCSDCWLVLVFFIHKCAVLSEWLYTY